MRFYRPFILHTKRNITYLGLTGLIINAFAKLLLLGLFTLLLVGNREILVKGRIVMYFQSSLEHFYCPVKLTISHIYDSQIVKGNDAAHRIFYCLFIGINGLSVSQASYRLALF